MTDILVNRYQETFSVANKQPLIVRYKDMGDGTFAEVRVTPGEINSGVAGGTAFTATVGPFTDTTSHVVKAAAGAGLKNKLTSYVVTNTSATASAFSFLDGATVIWTDSVPANSRTTYNFSVAPATTANTALNFQLATTATSTTVSVTGNQGA